MAEIRPFKALRYTPGRVPIAEVVTQPYDKISSRMRERYKSQHPNNLVHVLLPEAGPSPSAPSRYRQAAEIFGKWRREGIIEQIDTPCLFAYFQRYAAPDTGDLRTRKGFVCLTRLEDYANEVVFPHERTLSGPKKDRLELLRHTSTHFGQVFLLYSDPEREADALLGDVASVAAELEVRDEFGVEHMLWPISETDTIRAIQAAVADKKLVIADGHHRYETALAFRDAQRRNLGLADAGNCEWLMTTLVNMDSPGLTILPTHRVVQGLPAFDADRLLERARAFFHVRKVDGVQELESRLRTGSAGRPTIGVGLRDQLAVFELREELDLARLMPDESSRQLALDVVVLHHLVLERCLEISESDVGGGCLTYVRGTEEAIGAVQSDGAQAAFLLNPTRIEQVRDIAFNGEVLPQKSTDFFPKLLSGLTMYSIE